jgi:hypothetical protein
VNDRVRIAQTAAVLRRASIGLGALGAMLLMGLSVPIARVTFGGEHQTAIAVLSAVVFFHLVSAGQTVLIQDMRSRICAGIRRATFSELKWRPPRCMSTSHGCW